jgi:hypothetical protein
VNAPRANARVTRRQEILDWLRKNPDSTIKQIAAAIHAEARTTGDYVKQMRDDREIASSERTAGHYSYQTHRALVEATGYVPLPNPRSAPKSTPKAHRPGYHNGMDRAHPLPNQGGQGSGRRAFGIKSSLE